MNTTIKEHTQKLIMEFFIKYSIPKILIAITPTKANTINNLLIVITPNLILA